MQKFTEETRTNDQSVALGYELELCVLSRISQPVRLNLSIETPLSFDPVCQIWGLGQASPAPATISSTYSSTSVRLEI